MAVTLLYAVTRYCLEAVPLPCCYNRASCRTQRFLAERRLQCKKHAVRGQPASLPAFGSVYTASYVLHGPSALCYSWSGSFNLWNNQLFITAQSHECRKYLGIAHSNTFHSLRLTHTHSNTVHTLRLTHTHSNTVHTLVHLLSYTTSES